MDGVRRLQEDQFRSVMACLSARQDPQRHSRIAALAVAAGGIVSLSHVNSGPPDSRRLPAPSAGSLADGRAVRAGRCRYRPSAAAPAVILGARGAGAPGEVLPVLQHYALVGPGPVFSPADLTGCLSIFHLSPSPVSSWPVVLDICMHASRSASFPGCAMHWRTAFECDYRQKGTS